MSILTQHAKLVIKMHNNGIDEKFIKKFSINEIIKCCERIENIVIKNKEYKYKELVQEALLEDENITQYVKIIYDNNLEIEKFIKLLKEIKEHNEKMSDYSIKDIINILTNKDLIDAAYYDYLKYFSNESIFLRKTITENLNYFKRQNVTRISELTNEEKELFKLEYLDDYNLIPIQNIKEVYEFLAKNKELRKFIRYLYTRELYIPLHLEEYNRLNMNTREIRKYIESIDCKIKDDSVMYQMLLNWLKNDCNLYDLKVINDKVNNMQIENLKNAFCNRTSYINFIYGNKLKRFPLAYIYGSKEDIIVYAIREDKRNFLKLIEDNIDEFLDIPSDSIIFYKKVYTKYINLNELTLKCLNKVKKMQYDMCLNLDELKEQTFTFEEIYTLYSMKKQYIQLYNELLDMKIDDRLLRIRQLAKKDLLCDTVDENEIKQIARRIREKPLYVWFEQDFNKIKDINIKDVIQILIHYDAIKKFLPELKNRNELSYILRNKETIVNYNSLKDLKDDMENIDEYWIKLKNDIGFTEEFLQTHKDSLKEFLLNNGSELAYTYYKNRNDEQKESFKLIVKAQIMGMFKKLKYHRDDLQKEIDYELNDKQIKTWTEENTKIIDGKYNIKEYDDFYHTMILGEYPKSTCLSYKEGAYAGCLLACFDSNKKILYAKINDKIVARAMVRLTKGKYNRKISKSLSFIDVENNTIANSENKEEKLTLFLERPYISGVSDDEVLEIKKLFIKLLKTKAKQMNALLVLSSNYHKAADEEFISTEYFMYISKSKSSSQYLDSLSGQATVVDEGQYKENEFLIWHPIEKEDVFFEKIFN